MDDRITHAINLMDGTRVVFGHRATAKEVFDLDAKPEGQIPTQYQDLMLRAAITEFGALPMPVPLSVLLKLDSIDRDDLNEAHNEFQRRSLGDRTAEILPDHKARMAFGFKIGDSIYDVAQFGGRLTGMDDVLADKKDLTAGVKRLCFLVGRQISKLSQSDGPLELDGPTDLELFESLDAADIWTLRGAAELWRQSFRLGRKAVSENGDGADSAAIGDENRVAGKGHSVAAG
jgi:hypothetical protein